MAYVVTLTFETAEPVTVEALERAAAVGGAASAVGDRQIETTITVHAAGPAEAIEAAAAALMVRGAVVGAEVITEEEADRHLDAPPFPELAGVGEVAEMLGISRQRVHILRKRHDFPAPVQTLGGGPIWRKGDLTTFAGGWQRKAGRPAAKIMAGAEDALAYARGDTSRGILHKGDA